MLLARTQRAKTLAYFKTSVHLSFTILMAFAEALPDMADDDTLLIEGKFIWEQH